MLDLVGGDGLEEEAGVELPPGEGEPNVVHRADTRLPAHRPNTHLPTCTRQVKIIPRNNFIILCMPIIDQSRNKPLLDVCNEQLLPGEDPRDVDVLQVEHRGHQRLLVQLGHGGPVHNNILLQLCTQQSFMMF